MSISRASSSSLHECRWEWCRDLFDTADKLAKHVLDDHVAKETPVRKEDLRLEMRAHDGTSIGEDSIRTSLLMHEDAFLADEDKDTDTASPSPTFFGRSPIPQQTDGTHEVLRNGHDPSFPPQFGLPAPPLFGPDAVDPSISAVHRPLEPIRPSHSLPPERTPPLGGTSFRSLSAYSSPSPKSDSMNVAPAPSLAEMLANTLIGVNKFYSARTVGRSPRKRADPGEHSKPPSLKRVNGSSRPPSALGRHDFTELQLGESSQPLKGDGLRSTSSHSWPRSRSRSHTSPNTSHKQPSNPGWTIPTLPAILEAANATLRSPSRTQSPTRHSSASILSVRPFRTGTIRLEPNPISEAPAEPSPSHTSADPNTRCEPRAHPEAENPPALPPPVQPQPHANAYLDDIDMLSSLDTSIPAFTQAFDVQGQSQWPLATQAPYSFDSQLAFSSQ